MTAHAGGAAPYSLIDHACAPSCGPGVAPCPRTIARVRRDNSHASCDARNLLRPGRRIAVYVAHDSEADPSAIVRLARRNRCELYLPAIADYRHRRMEFRRYARDTRLRPNRYGIAEPERGASSRIAVRHLDLVLVPLVAVDAHGTRLGTGAGFYDRCLQHLRAGRRWRRPKLIGLGYEFQRVDHARGASLGRAAGRAAHRERSLRI